jgi:hypothetical protein
MTEQIERAHGWSHLVLFLMLFMLALAVMRVGSPTGMAAGNETINANGVGDLKPFLTAVGLLMGLFIAIVIALNANILGGGRAKQETKVAMRAKQNKTELRSINERLSRIQQKLK